MINPTLAVLLTTQNQAELAAGAARAARYDLSGRAEEVVRRKRRRRARRLHLHRALVTRS